MIEAERLGAIVSVAANAAGITAPLYHWQVCEVTVTADPPQTVKIDGEVTDPTLLTGSVIPNTIKVIVPPDPPKGNAQGKSNVRSAS